MEERGHSKVFWGATCHKLDIIVTILGGSHVFPVRPLEWGEGIVAVVSIAPECRHLQGHWLFFASVFAFRLHMSYFAFKRQKSAAPFSVTSS